MTKIDRFYQEVQNQIRKYYRYGKKPDIELIYNFAGDAGVPPTMVEEVIRDTMSDMLRLYATTNSDQ